MPKRPLFTRLLFFGKYMDAVKENAREVVGSFAKKALIHDDVFVFSLEST